MRQAELDQQRARTPEPCDLPQKLKVSHCEVCQAKIITHCGECNQKLTGCSCDLKAKTEAVHQEMNDRLFS